VKAAKVRESNDAELLAKEKELAEQMFKLRFQKAIGQLDNALKLRATRRDIARIKTVLNERRRAAQKTGERA
jgi:large subunit ribosomal protein L29